MHNRTTAERIRNRDQIDDDDDDVIVQDEDIGDDFLDLSILGDEDEDEAEVDSQKSGSGEEETQELAKAENNNNSELEGNQEAGATGGSLI